MGGIVGHSLLRNEPPRPKTVVLLGAGASHASRFKLPLMRGFFDLDDRELGKPLREFLAWFFDGDPADYNLEEALSYLHLGNVRGDTWTGWKRRYAAVGGPHVYEDLLDYVGHRLGPMIPRNEQCELHLAMFRALAPGDSVLSLNYDLVADAALDAIHRERTPLAALQPHRSRVGKLGAMLRGSAWAPNPEGAGLVPIRFDDGFYLKLHGSLDWLRCEDSECPRHASCERVQDLGERLSIFRETWTCDVCGAPMWSFIVPPLASKTALLAGPVRLMWRLAFRELQVADRVVVVGVSFAHGDVDLRWLVRQAREYHPRSPPELVLVNPSTDDRATAIRLFGRDCHLVEFGGLEQYVASLPPDKPSP